MAAGDINLDYATIQTVAGKLLSAQETISPQITDLKTQVDNLLTKDGGLWMNSTSPAIQHQYESFNTSLTQAVMNIKSFSDMFSSFVKQMQDMDTNYAAQVNNPSSS